jgi:RHS repeat-associated protein
MGSRLSARRYGIGTRLVALSLALTVVRMRPASGEPGDIFTVAAPVSSSAGPTATPIADGDSSVSTQTGAFTYSYPLALPPGRGGAKPALALSYTSQGPIYGTLAAGWSLSLPIIYRDTSAGRLSGDSWQYISSMAGGERLIRVPEAAPGWSVAYRAQHDASFARYQMETNPSLGYFWRALAADGTTYYFGHTDSHTTGCANVSVGYAPLTRTEDAFHNAVDYTWERGVDGECRIKSIKWGQNAAAGVGYFAAVEFIYSPTTYACGNVPIGSQTSYRTGKQIVSGASQLDTIKISAFSPRPLAEPIPTTAEHTRTISLTYSTNPSQSVSTASSCTAKHGAYRELLSIQESAIGVNAPQVTLPKMDFRYGDALPAYKATNAITSVTWAASDPAPLNLGWGYRFNTANEPWPTVEAMMIDLDGDGRIDRLVNEPYRHSSGRLFCNAHFYRNTGNGFADGGTIPMPTLKWATPSGTANPYSGGLTANSKTNVIERCALNYQRTAYRNATVGGVTCNNPATAPGGNGYCTPVGKPGYGTDSANAKGTGGDTFIAWRWYDIDGDRRPDLVGSPVRGGLSSYDFQYGKKAPDTTINVSTAEPPIFGTFPACPPDRFPSKPSYTSDKTGAYTMCNGMYPYFVYHNNGDGSFGGPRTRAQQRNWFLFSTPPHDSWGPSPTTILYQPVPLESDSGDSALWPTPVGQDSGSLDIDGDGYTDGVNIGTSSWSVWRNDATGTGQMIPMTGTTPFSFGGGSGYMLSETQKTPESQPLGVQGLEDMNGDGLLDHWGVGTPGDVMAAVVPNDGAGFNGSWAYLADRAGTDAYTTRVEWDNWSPYYVHKGYRVDRRRALDVDRDGRADIVRFADGSTAISTIQFNHGGQFGAAAGRLGEFGDPLTPGINDGGLQHHIVVNDGLNMPYETWEVRSDMIDLDGDGYLESVDFGASWSPQLSELKTSGVGTLTHPGRLLYEIKNNIGATTTINYASLHSSPTVTYSPNRVVPESQWVVQSTTTSDSISGTTSTASYQYKNPVFSPSLEGVRRWAFRGFEEVTATASHGMQTVERYDYAVDYTGRLKTKLIVPAATDSPTPIAGEVRSIDETTWEQRTLFGGLVKTFHPTASDHWTCKNGQIEAACRANTDTHRRITTTLTPLVSTTGPDTSTQLMWRVTGSRSQTGVAPAEGDRASTTTFALAADVWTYRLQPLVSKQQTQQGGQLVTFAKSEQTWDDSFRVSLTEAIALSNLDAPCTSANCLITSRAYDLKTGNVTRTTDARGNSTTYSFDSRALFIAAEDRPLTASDVEYEYEYGTGTKTVTRGPLWAYCAIYHTPYCEPGMRIHNEHRVKIDAIGRTLEIWKSVNDHPGFYDFRPVLVETYEYKDNTDDGHPTSVVHKAALDESQSVVRWTKDSTEFDGSGRAIRKTAYALGSAPADAITLFGYNNAGILSTVAVPDPTSNSGAQVTFLYSADSLGRPISVRRPDAASVDERSGVDITYDGLTMTTTEVVGAGGGNPAVTSTTVDVFGRTTSVDEVRASSSTATTTYEYAPDNTVSEIIDPENVVTKLVHDAAGRRTAITRGSRTWRYTYDPNGNVIASTAPCSPSPTCDAAYTTTFQYDELNRPTWRLIAPRDLSVADRDLFAVNSEYQSYDYGANATGRPTQWRSYGASAANGDDWSLVEDFQYDPDGNVLTHGQRFKSAGFAELYRDVLHQYTLSGALWKTSYRDYVNGGGQYTQAEYEYDNRGLPSAVWISTDRGVTWPNPPTIETRNVAGLLTERRTQDLTGSMSAIESDWSYDVLGRVRSQVVRSELGPATIAKQELTYFGNDDPKTMTDYLGASSHQYWFQYDKRHQLTNVDVTTSQGPVLTARYAYGDSGRLAGVVQENVRALPGGNLIPRDVAYQYGGTDPEEVTALVPNDPAVPFGMTYQYDEVGNQTMRCSGTITSNVCSGESLSFLYDGKNQLRRVTKRNAAGDIQGSEEYWYDSSGTRNIVLRRDSAGNKTELIWTIEGTESHFDESGTVTNAYSYVSLGTPVARVERTSDTATTIEYQFHGVADNTLAVVDQLSGTVNASFSYTPFGEIIESTSGGGATSGTDAHLRRVNDKQVDPLSDLAYYGARYFDRTAIAWTQADPLFHVVPDLAKAGTPRRANLYQFSLSNPLRYIDPDGLDSQNWGANQFFSRSPPGSLAAAGAELESQWVVGAGETLTTARRLWGKENLASGGALGIAAWMADKGWAERTVWMYEQTAKMNASALTYSHASFAGWRNPGGLFSSIDEIDPKTGKMTLGEPGLLGTATGYAIIIPGSIALVYGATTWVGAIVGGRIIATCSGAARGGARNFATRGLLESHFADHAAEWGGTLTMAGYLQRARDLLSAPVAGNIAGATRITGSRAGDMLRYNFATNEFAVSSSSGIIRTLFRPADGAAYWFDQLTKL